MYNVDELPAEDGKFWQRSLAAFGVDELYGRTIVAPGRKASDWAAETMDPKVIDGAAHGIGYGVRGFGSVLGRMQTGQVREYAGGLAVAGVVLVVVFVVVGGGF
jgi:NADH-quinone oxidoreductase subunit L